MKTMLIGLSVFGLTNLANAQEPRHKVSKVRLDEIVMSPMKNVSYYNAVYDPKSSVHVKQLESEVSNYDITKSEIFSNSFATYNVMFANAKGKIIAMFDSNGDMVNSIEKFEDVKLPEYVRKTLSLNYPDWALNSIVYRVNYYKGKDVRKVYNVQLKKDHEKLNLKIDGKGVILRSSN